MERKQNIEEIFENAKEPHPFNLVMLSIRLDSKPVVTIL
jgi:hypothetical protein